MLKNLQYLIPISIVIYGYYSSKSPTEDTQKEIQESIVAGSKLSESLAKINEVQSQKNKKSSSVPTALQPEDQFLAETDEIEKKALAMYRPDEYLATIPSAKIRSLLTKALMVRQALNLSADEITKLELAIQRDVLTLDASEKKALTEVFTNSLQVEKNEIANEVFKTIRQVDDRPIQESFYRDILESYEGSTSSNLEVYFDGAVNELFRLSKESEHETLDILRLSMSKVTTQDLSKQIIHNYCFNHPGVLPNDVISIMEQNNIPYDYIKQNANLAPDPAPEN